MSGKRGVMGERWGTNNFGIGIDLESIDRFTGPECNQNSALLNKIFTKAEQEYCFGKGAAASHLAARYAGKEAIVKALTSLGRVGLNYRDIEIISDKSGVPTVRINKAGFLDLQMQLSLSHCKDKAIAFAVVVETRQR